MRNDPWESLALGPDQTYGFAPDMAAELAALLAETTQLATGPAGRFDKRKVLLRQVALMDRLAEAGGGALGASRLRLAAARLVDFDQKHDTGRGRIPASDRAWELDPVGYVRQEYARLLGDTDRDGNDFFASKTHYIGAVAMTLLGDMWDLECTACDWVGTDWFEEHEFGADGWRTVEAWAQQHDATHNGEGRKS